MSSQSSRTSSPDVGEQVVLRQDLQPQNGSLSSLSSSRHTMGKYFLVYVEIKCDVLM
jgi:hypothetical protein